MTATAILLCGDATPAPNGTGDGGLDATTWVVAHLCSEPERIRSIPSGTTRLVLGLCGGQYSLGAVQREVRRAGLDPLGVEIVDLRAAAGDVGRLAVLVAAATSRAAAFAGTRPEHAKMRFASQTTRRGLLTFALPEYLAAPAIDHSSCAAEIGCRICVDTCPQGALTLTDGRVAYDRSLCEPCGRCVTGCPTGATQNPAVTPVQLEAELAALLDCSIGPSGPRGIVFRCRRSTAAETEPGWYPITVPCTGMLTAAWILAPLVSGASAVAVRPCSHGGCPLGHDHLVSRRLAWCRDLLAAAGLSAQRLPHEITSPLGPALEPVAIEEPFGPLGAAQVVLALCSTAVPGDLELGGPGSPLGVVDIDPSTCTRCGSCATSCPTGALAVLDSAATRSITFDPRACVACGNCVERCPEQARGAIRLRAAVDGAALANGRRVMATAEVHTCEACGAAVAPAAQLDRLTALIDDDRVMDVLRRRCPRCRGMAVSPV